jgi:hypothetical protein
LMRDSTADRLSFCKTAMIAARPFEAPAFIWRYKYGTTIQAAPDHMPSCPVSMHSCTYPAVALLLLMIHCLNL